MRIGESIEKLDDKLGKLYDLASRTDENVNNIKNGFDEHKKHCREDMAQIWTVATGRGGHSERITKLETKWTLFSKRGIATGAGTSAGVAGLLWLIIEVLIPMFSK